jgi:DNA invertase Pin-like site-specific DNA recombinase
MKERPVHVIGYTRVSTEEQATSGLGLEDQHRHIAAEADRRSWTVDWVEDAGWSAKDLNRPGITAALTSLREGEAQALVVAKLDRLSRSLMDFAGLMATARREGWALVALDLGVDTSTPQGEMMANVMATFAHFERRLIGERTRAALAVRKSQGVRLGRPRAISATTAEQVGRWRATGCSYQAIADTLNRMDVPTGHGGRQWYPSTVRGVLRSLALDAEAAALSAEVA